MEKAKWSNDSRYIAYTSRPADAGYVGLLGVYDTETEEEISVTNRPYIENLDYTLLDFIDIDWLEDDSGIKVHYGAIKAFPDDPDRSIVVYGKKIGEGYVVISLETE